MYSHVSEYEHRLAGTLQERVFVPITNPRWKAQPPWHLICWSNKREAVGSRHWSFWVSMLFRGPSRGQRSPNAHCGPSVASAFSTVRWGLRTPTLLLVLSLRYKVLALARSSRIQIPLFASTVSSYFDLSISPLLVSNLVMPSRIPCALWHLVGLTLFRWSFEVDCVSDVCCLYFRRCFNLSIGIFWNLWWIYAFQNNRGLEAVKLWRCCRAVYFRVLPPLSSPLGLRVLWEKLPQFKWMWSLLALP
jgi:hypothetical protein